MKATFNKSKLEIGFETNKIYPALEDLEVTPSGEKQVFKHPNSYGYDKVIVDAVESKEIIIIPKLEEQVNEGLFKKVTIKGIETEEKTVDLNFENTDLIEITPNKDKYLIKIKIEKPNNLVPENIKKDETLFGVKGSGKMANAKITSGYYLFYNGHREDYLNEILSLCDKITSMYYMFGHCSFENIDLSKLDTSNVTDMRYAFYSIKNIKTLDLSNFVTSNVNDMSAMFGSCSSLKDLDLSSFNTNKVTNMKSMFGSCTSIESLDLSNFDTSNVSNMSNMFNNMTHLKSLDISSFNTSKVTDMSQMFTTGSNELTVLDLTSFDTSNVTTMYEMFSRFKGTDLNLSSFDLSKLTNINSTFYECMLMNLKSFKNLGKGFTSKSNNYSNYRLNLSSCSRLTHESLIDVITNGLYDLNLTYNVANGGTLYTQSLQIGSSNKAKLTAEEIAIATNKGWTVS